MNVIDCMLIENTEKNQIMFITWNQTAPSAIKL